MALLQPFNHFNTYIGIFIWLRFIIDVTKHNIGGVLYMFLIDSEESVYDKNLYPDSFLLLKKCRDVIQVTPSHKNDVAT